jgi:hypothetical protein
MSATNLRDTSGWTPVIDDLVECLGLYPALVFGCVWRFCQMTHGVCHASIETMSVRLAISRSQTKHILKILVNEGFLRDLTPEQRHAPHVYEDTGKVASIAHRKKWNLGVATSEDHTSPEEGESDISALPVAIVPVQTILPEAGGQEVTTSAEKGGYDVTINKTLLREKEDMIKIWDQLLENFRRETSLHWYRQYLEPCAPVSWKDGILTVEAEDEDARDFIQGRFLSTANRQIPGIADDPDATVEIVAPCPPPIPQLT